ncbi:MAG: hypothetical protein AAGL69_14795 [Pseudomonadota bacterium]
MTENERWALTWDIKQKLKEMGRPYQLGTFVVFPVGLALFTFGVCMANEFVTLAGLFFSGIIPPLFYAWMQVFLVREDAKIAAKEAGEQWGPLWLAATALGVLVYNSRFPSVVVCVMPP